MKKLMTAIALSVASIVAVPAVAADWLYQLEQTRRFQKKPEEKRARDKGFAQSEKAEANKPAANKNK